MYETSRIELSQSALKKNIRFLKRQIGKKTVFSSVIKGNAYGHGSSLFVPMAEQCGLRHFSVFSADEALQAFRSKNENSRILIMGDIHDDAVYWAVENDISFYVFDSTRMKSALRAAKRVHKKARVHLEIETGLNRTGFFGKALKQAVSTMIKNKEHLVLEGICTHYAGAENLSNYLRIQNQLESFNQQYRGLSKQLARPGLSRVLRHTACSAAMLTYPETIMDMVRIGIAQYGFWPSKETEIHFSTSKNPKQKRSKQHDPLVRVIKWVSRVMSTKKVKRGEYVGYGSSSLVTRDLKLAAVPVGYFHGFSRDQSNKGHVLVRGRRAPVVGMVNMNMIMIDITDVPDVRTGDEIVIIGKQGDNTISVGSFGELARCINYELLVSLPSEIPRVVVD